MALSRLPPSVYGELPGVQILRGLAALAVLIHHVLEESQPLFGDHIPSPLVLLGAGGVDIFFVISGFIMYYTNRDRFGRKGAPVDFLGRRVIRIVPLYWLCTFVIVFLHIGGLYINQRITGVSLGLSLLFLPNANIVLGVGWTLNFEMYFYAILAVWLLFGTARASILGVISSILLIMALGSALPSGATRTFFTNPVALELCFGFVLAAVFTGGYISARIVRSALVIGIAGFVLGSAFGPSDGTTGLAPHIRFLLWGIPATALLVSALFARQVETYVGRCLLLLVGDSSYSVYLTHAFVMTAYAKILKLNILLNVPRPVCMLTPVLVSLAVGVATYLLIEHPMNERLKVCWKNRLIAATQEDNK